MCVWGGNLPVETKIERALTARSAAAPKRSKGTAPRTSSSAERREKNPAPNPKTERVRTQTLVVRRTVAAKPTHFRLCGEGREGQGARR